MTASVIGFVMVLVLSLLRVPIAFAMGIVGFVGFGLEIGWSPSFALVAQVTYDTGLDYGLSVVPLFVMMGVFVAHAGLSDDLFNASNAFLGHRRGGLAMASIVACGGFGAICGSSIATVATMARVAMPSMRRFGYDDRLAAGSIAAGGTLGILIPPSIVLIIYGLLTETSIGKLFAAGFLPGLLAIFCYAMAVQVVTARNEKLGPAAARTDWRGRLVALRDVWGVLLLFIVVIGGIYAGVFTPTEAAGIGAAVSFLFALLRGRLTLRTTIDLLMGSAYITAVLFIVLIGALIFANFINTAGLPSRLQEFIGDLEVPPLVVIWVIVIIYIVLGAVFETLSMILLTVPVLFPVVESLGLDPVWFGIIVVCVAEISLITPPVGLNIFVLRGVLPDVSTATIYRGVLPFVLADFIRLAILIHISWIALVLPRLIYG